MPKNLVIEVRDFLSLREIVEDLEERIAQYNLMKEEYSRELGSYLRRTEEKYKDEEWFKKLSLDKLKGGAREKKEKKKGKRKKGKASTSSCWIPYKGLKISSTDQGEMELLFEAIEELERKIELLKGAKEGVEELVKVGLGDDLRYRVYIKEGVPEKIVVRPRGETSRFQLSMVFSTAPTPPQP